MKSLNIVRDENGVTFNAAPGGTVVDEATLLAMFDQTRQFCGHCIAGALVLHAYTDHDGEITLDVVGIHDGTCPVNTGAIEPSEDLMDAGREL